MKRFVFVFVFLTVSIFVNAQYIWVNGYVFSKAEERTNLVPFASVYYCDIDNHSKVIHMGFTDISGNYDIGKNVKVQNYFVKIFAPGYTSKTKSIGNLPSNVKGNLTLHFELLKKSTIELKKKTFLPKDLSEKTTSIIDILGKIPQIKKDDAGNFLTLDGGAVRLILNGYNIIPAFMAKLPSLSSAHIEKIEYYDLESFSDSAYQCVLNIVLKVGEKAGKIKFTPNEVSSFDI